MAACETCGQKAGFGKKLCDECTERAEQQRRQEQTAAAARQAQEEQTKREVELARRKQAEIDRKNRWDAYLTQRIGELRSMIEEGVTPYLYTMITVDSLSYFHDSPRPNAWNFKTEVRAVGANPSMGELQSLGLRGWELVSSIPVTFGASLYNQVGANTVNASAYAGLVVGAELLLRRPVTKRMIDEDPETVEELIKLEFPG